jgi:hypothetical protein
MALKKNLKFAPMGSRGLLRLFARHMGDIVIHLLVERHDPAHGADSNRVVGQQAPDAKLPGIRMALLSMIDLDHER